MQTLTSQKKNRILIVQEVIKRLNLVQEFNDCRRENKPPLDELDYNYYNSNNIIDLTLDYMSSSLPASFWNSLDDFTIRFIAYLNYSPNKLQEFLNNKAVVNLNNRNHEE